MICLRSCSLRAELGRAAPAMPQKLRAAQASVVTLTGCRNKPRGDGRAAVATQMGHGSERSCWVLAKAKGRHSGHDVSRLWGGTENIRRGGLGGWCYPGTQHWEREGLRLVPGMSLVQALSLQR